jgi:hypothetical protein
MRRPAQRVASAPAVWVEPNHTIASAKTALPRVRAELLAASISTAPHDSAMSA